MIQNGRKHKKGVIEMKRLLSVCLSISLLASILCVASAQEYASKTYENPFGFDSSTLTIDKIRQVENQYYVPVGAEISFVAACDGVFCMGANTLFTSDGVVKNVHWSYDPVSKTMINHSEDSFLSHSDCPQVTAGETYTFTLTEEMVESMSIFNHAQEDYPSSNGVQIWAGRMTDMGPIILTDNLLMDVTTDPPESSEDTPVNTGKDVTLVCYDGDVPFTTTIKNVLDVRTMTVLVSKYGSEYEQEITVYQIPEEGSQFIFDIPKEASVCPFCWGAYRLTDGRYNFTAGYIGMLVENTLPYYYSPYTLPFALAGENGINAGANAYDLVHIGLSSETELYFTCADLDDIVGIESEPEASENPFADVPADAYYADAVKWAYENGITTGTSATTFGPMDTCTRGQVVTFLWRAKGCPEPTTTVNPFTDVTEADYFYKAVLWAVENGITNGTGANTFAPADTCSSAHVVTFLWRANGKPAAAVESSLVENGQWYSDAVAWADSIGLLSGTDIPFSVANNAPRADIVTYLYRNIAA